MKTVILLAVWAFAKWLSIEAADDPQGAHNSIISKHD